MTIGALSTIFIVAVLLHNTEEAMFLPQWSRQAGRWHRQVSPVEFRVAVAILSALLVGVGVLAHTQGPRSISAYLFFGYVFAMTVNAFIPHLAATILLRRYMPGTITALGLNLPLGTYLLHQAIGHAWVAPGPLLWAAPAVAIALVGAIPLLFSIGRYVSRKINASAQGSRAA